MDLPEKLRIVSNMINMGERIRWGEETTLMDQAADEIESLRRDAERYRWLKKGRWITAEQFDSTVEYMGDPELLDAAIDGAMEVRK